jgi:hypothetical protein
MKRYKDFIEERCWSGYKPVPGKKPYSPGSCVKEDVITEGRPSQQHPLEGHDYHRKSDAELRYIAKDAHEAAEAMKSHNTRAENKYRDQANDSATVRYWRQKNGMPDWYKKKYGHIKEESEIQEDWQKVNKADKTDGLSQKAVNAYRRENPGSKLQTAVTEKNPTGKRASRRKSFCSRMGGMKKRLTNPENARDPDSPINKALRRWNC